MAGFSGVFFFVCDVFTCKYYIGTRSEPLPLHKKLMGVHAESETHILDKTCRNIKYHEAKTHKSNRQGEQNCVVRDSLAHVASLSCEVHPELEGPV